MPYISKDDVKKIREQIKREFINFKFSVTCKNYSTVHVSILEGNINLLKNESKEHEQVNQYYIESHYNDMPEARKMFNRIIEIIKTIAPIGKGHDDSDYGYIPSYYITLEVGTWNKPYNIKINNKKEAIKTNKVLLLDNNNINKETFKQGYKVYYRVDNKIYNSKNELLNEVQAKFINNLIDKNILKKVS